MPVDIPAVQAAIIARARSLGAMPAFARTPANGARVAVVGGGPAGYGAAAVLAQAGCGVDVFERRATGGMTGLIPPFRVDAGVLEADLEFVAALGTVSVTPRVVADPAGLLADGYDAVVVATGLGEPIRLGIPGEEKATPWTVFLAEPGQLRLAGARVAVVGGGAVATDCAETAVAAGASHVELFALESLAEMPLTSAERDGLLRSRAHLSGRTRVTEVLLRGGAVTGVRTRKVALPAGEKFHPTRVRDVEGTDQERPEFDTVVVAIGARAETKPLAQRGVFPAGDLVEGPTTVVEAVAAGKNAALEVLAFLEETGHRAPGAGRRKDETGGKQPDSGDRRRDPAVPGARSPVPDSGRARVKSFAILPGFRRLPVPLDADFFGQAIASPFLLSAAPPTDGYEQMRKAYEAGWAGGVMKTAFDGVPIHIPAEYMFAFDETTYGNCDNVSGHALDRVCREVERLRREYPGPADARLDRRPGERPRRGRPRGVAVQHPQARGGRRPRHRVLASRARRAATAPRATSSRRTPSSPPRSSSWVLEAGDPAVPKLFKLTAAVTSIDPIIAAIKERARPPPGRQGRRDAGQHLPDPGLPAREQGERGTRGSWSA